MENNTNPAFELRLELKAINEKINVFWEFYQYLTSANSITKRYYIDLFSEFEKGNFLNARSCIKKLVERLSDEVKDPQHQFVDYMFNAAIETLTEADCLCVKALDLIELANYHGMNEKQIINAKKKEIDIKLLERQEIQSPYLNLSLGIVFILMSVVFVFIPDYFNNPTLLYHICGFMFFFGFILIKQEVELRNKIGFVTTSKKLTTKRAFVSLILAVIYMIPLAVLSIFFYELLFIRILLFIQIWFCAVLLLNGIVILIVHSYTNKKMEKFSIWGFILGAISIIGFVIQILQLFNVL